MGLINKEKKRREEKFSCAHPFIDLLKNENFGFGVIITGLAFDPRDVDKIKEKSNQIGTTNKGPDETILRFKGRK